MFIIAVPFSKNARVCLHWIVCQRSFSPSFLTPPIRPSTPYSSTSLSTHTLISTFTKLTCFLVFRNRAENNQRLANANEWRFRARRRVGGRVLERRLPDAAALRAGRWRAARCHCRQHCQHAAGTFKMGAILVSSSIAIFPPNTAHCTLHTDSDILSSCIYQATGGPLMFSPTTIFDFYFLTFVF